MISTLTISIDIKSYWHCGSGRGGGDDADAIIETDSLGLPYIHGKHLKGLMREACEWLCGWGVPGWDSTLVDILFGRESTHKNGSLPGCVIIPHARLPVAFRTAVNADKALAAALKVTLASTAVDASGSAVDKSLRSMEAAVPLKLFTELRWDDSDRLLRCTPDELEKAKNIWSQRMTECLHFVLAVGAKRSRGFGRCQLRSVA